MGNRDGGCMTCLTCVRIAIRHPRQRRENCQRSDGSWRFACGNVLSKLSQTKNHVFITYPGLSVFHYSFGFPFSQRPWDLTKRWEDMVVADMVADKKREKADMELDMVADMVAGYGCWLIGPKLFRPEAYPTCVSSKLWEFIFGGSKKV